jgi:hypothetical protein
LNQFQCKRASSSMTSTYCEQNLNKDKNPM